MQNEIRRTVIHEFKCGSVCVVCMYVCMYVYIFYVTGFWKMVPNHTFLFQYIYHCNMKSIAFPIIFHSTTRNSMLKLLKECKKYSVNTYT